VLFTLHVENEFILGGDREHTPVGDLVHFRLKEELKIILVEHYILFENGDNLLEVDL